MRKNLLTKYIEEEDSARTETGKKSKTIFSAGQSTAFQSSFTNTANTNKYASRPLEEFIGSSFNIKDEDSENAKDFRLHEIQCELNNQGASDLVVDLFMNDISNKIFKENVLLAIALLEGGNTQVQVN